LIFQGGTGRYEAKCAQSARPSVAFSQALISLLLFLLPIFAAHAQPTSWQSYQEGFITYYQGTDANGGRWTGSSYEQWGLRFYEFTGPDGQTQHCRAYSLPGARNTECWP
jgi:hypothetical protein